LLPSIEEVSAEPVWPAGADPEALEAGVEAGVEPVLEAVSEPVWLEVSSRMKSETVVVVELASNWPWL